MAYNGTLGLKYDIEFSNLKYRSHINLPLWSWFKMWQNEQKRGFFFLWGLARFLRILQKSILRPSTNGIYVKCVPTDLSRDVSHSFLNSLNLVFVAATLSCCFAAAVYKVSWKKKKKKGNQVLLGVFCPPMNFPAYQQLSFIFNSVVWTKHISLSRLRISLHVGGLLSWEPKSPFVKQEVSVPQHETSAFPAAPKWPRPSVPPSPPVGHWREFLGVKCAIYYYAAANEIWPLERRLSI